MQLILTANQKLHNNYEKYILAGEWCNTWENRKIISKYNLDIIPYHWDNRKKLYNDLLYLDELYEKILKQLSIVLNNLHGCNYSLRFWRIIVGMWLSQFICMYFDRYQSLHAAKEFEEISRVSIIKNDPRSFIIDDAKKFNICRSTDIYNHYLFSEIIQITNIKIQC